MSNRTAIFSSAWKKKCKPYVFWRRPRHFFELAKSALLASHNRRPQWIYRTFTMSKFESSNLSRNIPLFLFPGEDWKIHKQRGCQSSSWSAGHFFFITYRRWEQSTSYNVAHPASDLKESTHLSPVHIYNLVSRCRISTPTPRQPLIELFVLAFSRFPRRKSEEKYTFFSFSSLIADGANQWAITSKRGSTHLSSVHDNKRDWRSIYWMWWPSTVTSFPRDVGTALLRLVN